MIKTFVTTCPFVMGGLKHGTQLVKVEAIALLQRL